MTRYRQKLWELLPVGLLIICVLLFFIDIVFSCKSLYGSDFVFYFHPVKKFVRQYLLTEGSLPFWNPYQFSGVPIIANIQASMFYPPGFLYYLVSPELAYGYSTILHCMLGSVFMYGFMRTLSVSPAGSFISAAIFTFNGYFMGHLYAGHLSFVQSYVWIPLIFRFLYRFVQTGRFKDAVIAGLVLGIQILGGFPQIAFYAILGTLVFVLFHGVILLRSRLYRDASRLALGLVVILCAGFALASIEILPTMEFTGLSTRAGGVSYDFATYDSLHPKELLSFLIPDIFGNVVDETYWRTSEGWHFWETCGYVGILPLFLIFTKTESRSIRRLRGFFMMLIVLSLLLAFGRHNPLYPIIYKLPGFNSFRIPAQIIFLYVFGFAVVSGMGMHRMQEDEWQFNRGFVPFFALIGILLLFLLLSLSFFPYYFFFHLFRYFAEGPIKEATMAGLYERISISLDKGALLFLGASLLVVIRKSNRLSPRAFSILASAIVMLDLYLFGAQFIKPHEFVTPPTKQNIVAQLSRDSAQGRVVTMSEPFKANDGLQYRFPSILGYDPLILRRYLHYIQSSQNYPICDHVVSLAWINDPGAKLLKMLGVRQMVLDGQVTDLDNVVPYVHLVNDAVIMPSDKILPFMRSDEFDPQRMVVFEPEYRSNIISGNESETFRGSCSIVEYGSENIRINTSSNQPGYLVLSEVFYPGWKATVDGKRVEVLCGNYLFRVISLDKGEHEVRLYFVSWPFRIGALVSLLTLAGSLWFILWRRRRDLILHTSDKPASTESSAG